MGSRRTCQVARSQGGAAVSNRLDKLRRLQEALDAMWAAAREADSAFNTDEASDLQSVIDEQDEEIARLKAENERLRKAGDAMENALMCSGCSECEGMYDSHDEAIDGWHAAKGVQS